jgi:hypothetical protein
MFSNNNVFLHLYTSLTFALFVHILKTNSWAVQSGNLILSHKFCVIINSVKNKVVIVNYYL